MEGERLVTACNSVFCARQETVPLPGKVKYTLLERAQAFWSELLLKYWQCVICITFVFLNIKVEVAVSNALVSGCELKARCQFCSNEVLHRDLWAQVFGEN